MCTLPVVGYHVCLFPLKLLSPHVSTDPHIYFIYASALLIAVICFAPLTFFLLSFVSSARSQLTRLRYKDRKEQGSVQI